ncbi:hypothetical protein [Kitasatospora sp. GAS204B]|uniref:hypothetical protein n=1 Tax=unclassified Kitasatospora TaxID=2633591 RepID=UPI002476B210|nr:hypothetical protein [Kitasatospora sp. GAS204B]MDH6118193.1 hypothetical protein [Kitasatospora sp. GAS204B]
MSSRQEVLRLALRCYPKRYRVERGAEIAEVYAETTEEAGRFGRARELYGVAAYGVRLRLGLASSQPAGRLLGTAAPLVAGVWAGVSLLWLLELLGGSILRHFGLFTVLWFAQFVFAGPALIAVLLDRWTLVRCVALLAVGVTVLVEARQMYAFMPGATHWPFYLGWVLEQLAPLVWPLLLLAVPRDLLDLDLGRVGRHRPWSALAMVLGSGFVSITGAAVRVLREPLAPWAELGTALALILVTAAVVRRGALTLPLLAVALFSLLEPLDDLLFNGATPGGELIVLPLGIAALAQLRRERSRRAGTGVPLG